MSVVEPPAKKAKVEDSPAEAKEETISYHVEDEDAPDDSRPRISDIVAFHDQDTTLNVLAHTHAPMLTSISDGGMQYLLAGARANVGIATGRYTFEIKIMEALSVPMEHQSTVAPRHLLRVGVATQEADLIIGGSGSSHSICYDSEGYFHSESTKTKVSPARFVRGDVIAVVLNLNIIGVNAQTISIYRNNKLLCKPQSIPECLKGEHLYPAITYRNMGLVYNFDDAPLSPLPFSCRMWQDAAKKDSTIASATPAPQDGKYDVLLPIGLPNQGLFDWADLFLQKNPQYVEISDRAILRWADRSEIKRPKGYGPEARTSNDKPGMGFGIPMMDDLSIKKALHTFLPMMKRHCVIMELKDNLVRDSRRDVLAKWFAASCRRVAVVAVGTPSSDYTEHFQSLFLEDKQATVDMVHKQKMVEHQRKVAMKQKQKDLEKKKNGCRKVTSESRSKEKG